MLNHIPVLIVLFPLLMAGVVALVPSGRVAWGLALIATGLGFTAALIGISREGLALHQAYALGGWLAPWGIEFVADGASMLVAVVIGALSFLSTIYAKPLIEKEIPTHLIPRAYSAWLLAIGGMEGIVMTGDAFNLFVFFEIASLATVSLIALVGGTDRRALMAAYSYLIIGAVGATLYVIGVGFCYAVTGTLNMVDLMHRLPLTPSDASVVVAVGLAFMVAGILVKAAIFPVHIWLPAAYGYAPSAVSVLLAAVGTKAALCALARVLFTVFGQVEGITAITLEWILLPFSLIAIGLGTMLALWEKDLKLLLAQSSIAQIGYIALGFSLGTAAGVEAGFIHIVNHAFIKGGLFMAVGAMVWASAGSGRITLDRDGGLAGNQPLAGIGRRMPITSTALLICGLGLIGLPLTAGFISKVYLVLALIATKPWWVVGFVVLFSALSVVYLWRIVEVMWFQPSEDTARIRENPMITLPLWVLALAVVWFGVQASPIIAMAESAAFSLNFGGEP